MNINTNHKKNKHTCFSYVVLARNHRDISTGISTKKTDVFFFPCAHVAVIPSEDNIRKTSVFVLLMLRARYVYTYAAAVLTSVMLMLMR